jgi:benzodiazapine receptor
MLRWFAFFVINFSALGIGSLFTGKGVPSQWYINLNKPSWMPPGWMFGAAWTTIMVCFTFYMNHAWKTVDARNHLILFFVAQWILNVAWNPVFFGLRGTLPALFVISALTILLIVFIIFFWSEMKLWSLFMLPYIIWLVIATSLNGYIHFNN